MWARQEYNLDYYENNRHFQFAVIIVLMGSFFEPISCLIVHDSLMECRNLFLTDRSHLPYPTSVYENAIDTIHSHVIGNVYTSIKRWIDIIFQYHIDLAATPSNRQNLSNNMPLSERKGKHISFCIIYNSQPSRCLLLVH